MNPWNDRGNTPQDKLGRGTVNLIFLLMWLGVLLGLTDGFMRWMGWK